MKWKTKDGAVMELSEMTDSHLINAKNLLQRRLASKPHQVYCGDSDYASGAVGQENEQNAQTADYLNAVLCGLEKEIKKRNLTT